MEKPADKIGLSVDNRPPLKPMPWTGDLITEFQLRYPIDRSKALDRREFWTAIAIIGLSLLRPFSIVIAAFMFAFWLNHFYVWIACAIATAMFFWGAGKGVFSIIVGDPTERNYGVLITRDEAPDLFAVIDEVGKNFRYRPIHKILMGEGNGAYAFPRSFCRTLFWKRGVDLRIDYGFFRFMAIDELKTVITHEMYHLFVEGHKNLFVNNVAWGLDRFFYTKRYWGLRARLVDQSVAIAWVKAKRSEVAACESTAKLSPSEAYLRTDIRNYIFASHLDSDGPSQQPGFRLRPTTSPAGMIQQNTASVVELIKAPQACWSLYRRLRNLIEGPFDRHPTFRRRLGMGGMEADSIVSADQLALFTKIPEENAVGLLGKRSETIVEDLNQLCIRRDKEKRLSAIEYNTNLKNSLVAEEVVATIEQAWAQAAFSRFNFGIQHSLKWVRRVLEISPDDPFAKLWVAEAQISGDEQEKQQAAEELQKLAKFPSTEVAQEALYLLATHYRYDGNRKMLDDVGRQQQALSHRQWLLWFEMRPTFFDNYRAAVPAQIPHRQIGKILTEFPNVKCVYLVRKRLVHCRTSRMWLMVVRFHFFRHSFGSQTKTTKLLAEKLDTLSPFFKDRVDQVEFHSPLGLKIARRGLKILPSSDVK